MNRFYKTLALLFFVILLQNQGWAQKQVRQINLLHTDVGRFDNVSGKSAQRLIGHVKAEHDGSILLCDSAYLYSKSNSMDAFGHVHIIINDSLDLFGDRLFYDGNTKIAEVHENVRLVDKKATLYTDELIYDRNTGVGKYYIWGKIVDSTNVLTSKKGYYYSRIETVFFKDSVVVVNPDYVMNSDTLKYETKSEKVYFLGPSTIIGDSSYLYAENGFYDTQRKESRLSQNAFL
jgi:lipopolysaccharide assembly outer membrane protein LptD (OstA)